MLCRVEKDCFKLNNNKFNVILVYFLFYILMLDFNWFQRMDTHFKVGLIESYLQLVALAYFTDP